MEARRPLKKTRKFTTDLLGWVQDRGRIVIIVHDNPDPDCLASALALRSLFQAKIKRDTVIAFSGMIGRSENLAMAKLLNLSLTPLEIVDLSQFEVICMLDTQPETGNNALKPGYRVDVVIDHHPLREATRKSQWVDVRETYGVTATILYEYLVAQDVPIGTKLATALFYAIQSETQELGREANRPDREAYLALFPLTNKKLLYQINHPKLPVENFLAIKTAIDNSMIYGCVLIANLGPILFPEVVAEMADFLLRLENIETVFCTGIYNDTMVLSIRTGRHDRNMGDIIRRMVSGIGAAGGHGMMAGGKIENVEASLQAEQVQTTLVERLLDELQVEKCLPKRLFESSHQPA